MNSLTGSREQIGSPAENELGAFRLRLFGVEENEIFMNNYWRK